MELRLLWTEFIERDDELGFDRWRGLRAVP